MNWTNVTVTLGELKPWERNPKTISKAHAKRLIEYWYRIGQFQSIAIGPGGEVYDGHQRLSVLLAAYGPGYQIDARQSEVALTDEERQELVIAAHVGTTGQFSWDELSGWDAQQLQDWGMDAETLASWRADATALTEMLAAAKEEPPEDPGAQIDKADELREKWGVETGQMWRLGEHRIICGDCTDRAVVERVMGGERAGAVVTDPPYGINREGIEHDDPEGLPDLFDGCLAVMPIENAVIIAFQSPRLFPVWLDAIRVHEHKFERSLWMHKSNDVTNPWRCWMMNGEPIFISSVGKPEWGITNAVQDCYIITHDVVEKIPHTSVKPMTVTEDLVKHTTGIVYEPFSGSGTTLIACERLGRKCRAVEISPAYVAVAIQRWVDMTGGVPELIQ